MSLSGWEALQAHIEAHPVTGSPQEMRDSFHRLAQAPDEVTLERLGGIEVARFGPGAGRPILWLHGGGLVFGSARSHAAAARRLAELTGRPVILPAYRLAPDHPWPAPLDDAAAALSACCGPDGTVDLIGDSAGGLMALHLARRATGKVRRLALISPNTDRTGRSRTRHVTTDLMNDDETDRALARLAFGADLAGHEDASPLGADLSDLPPVWITAATAEVLLDDTLLLVRALGQAGVPVTAEIQPGLCHLWMLWPDALPESRESYARLAKFLSSP